MDFIKNRNFITVFIAALACITMVTFPSIAFLAAQKGISLWASSVLPALLPFFICANFMNYMGVTRVLKPPFYAFVMSVMSGYPMGAKIIGDLRQSGRISAREARKYISFCSTSGPTFMIGAVGTGMLGNPLVGVVIAISHYAGAMLNGFVFSAFSKKINGNNCKNNSSLSMQKNNRGTIEIFTDSVFSSFKSLGIILSYIILFMFLTDFIQFSGLLNIFGGACAKAVVKGFMEMTVGCASVASCVSISLLLKCVLCTFIISWAGLSVIGQTMSMLSGCGVSLTYFLTVKLGHCVFSAAIAYLLGYFLL